MMAIRGGALLLFVELVVLCSLPVQPLQACATKKQPLVPALFVFGDSLVDVGNNNHLPNVNNSCKANFCPYGIDYPHRSPTGRFSNGYNLADQLAQQLGFAESPPPFLSLTNATARSRFARLKSTGGINFASGGSGLIPSTGGGKVCGGQVVSMAEQVRNFARLVGTWKSNRKLKRAASELVYNSLVFISVGSNDLFEYSNVIIDPSHRYNASRNDTAFLRGLVDLYEIYVKNLYFAGATKFSVVSPSLVGCCPSQRKIAEKSNDVDAAGCFATANSLSLQLYSMIKSMLRRLSQDELPGMSYSLGDAIGMAQWIFNHPSTPPKNFTTPCCGSADLGEDGCNSSAEPCKDRTSFFFWDRFHPTEASAAITAQQLFSDNGTFVHPINVRQLAASTTGP